MGQGRSPEEHIDAVRTAGEALRYARASHSVAGGAVPHGDLRGRVDLLGLQERVVRIAAPPDAATFRLTAVAVVLSGSSAITMTSSSPNVK